MLLYPWYPGKALREKLAKKVTGVTASFIGPMPSDRASWRIKATWVPFSFSQSLPTSIILPPILPPPFFLLFLSLFESPLSAFSPPFLSLFCLSNRAVWTICAVTDCAEQRQNSTPTRVGDPLTCGVVIIFYKTDSSHTLLQGTSKEIDQKAGPKGKVAGGY